MWCANGKTWYSEKEYKIINNKLNEIDKIVHSFEMSDYEIIQAIKRIFE